MIKKKKKKKKRGDFNINVPQTGNLVQFKDDLFLYTLDRNGAFTVEELIPKLNSRYPVVTIICKSLERYINLGSGFLMI